MTPQLRILAYRLPVIFRRVFACGVHNAQHRNSVVADINDRDIRQPAYHAFACALYTSNPGALWKCFKLTDLVPDPFVNRFRDAQAGLVEVIQQDVFEVLLSLFRPVDLKHKDDVMPILALS